MTSSMALALARTGWWFPFFSAWLGMIGVFLTGSDTSSNTLFGPLQATTAGVAGTQSDSDGRDEQLGRRDGQDDQPAESVGRRGRRRRGRDAKARFCRACVVHSLILTTLMGVLAMLQAYVVPWMVPTLAKVDRLSLEVRDGSDY